MIDAIGESFGPMEDGVLNPAETDVEVVRGAASIVSLFISSNQTILTRPVVGGGQD